LGSAAREAGVEIIRYPSGRCPPAGMNVAVMTPFAFSRKRPTTPSTWDWFLNGNLMEMRQTNHSRPKVYQFNRAAFEVDGALPSPAL
jgi:hypothetical protein